VKKMGFGGRAGISPKFYKCGRFEGKGNKALQITTIIKVFHCGW
jgi:hypothetical protein